MVAFLDTHACDVLVTDYSMPGGAYGDGIPLLSFVMRRYAIETGLVSAATPQSPEEQA
nr:hypothetical protein [Ralstonia mannitolilytica]